MVKAQTSKNPTDKSSTLDPQPTRVGTLKQVDRLITQFIYSLNPKFTIVSSEKWICPMQVPLMYKFRPMYKFAHANGDGARTALQG